jgi:hypothetical protein
VLESVKILIVIYVVSPSLGVSEASAAMLLKGGESLSAKGQFIVDCHGAAQ